MTNERAKAFTEAAEYMQHMIDEMKDQQVRVWGERRAARGLPTRDWPGSYIADRTTHLNWLLKKAEEAGADADDADAEGIPAGKHVFEISVRSRFANGDWWSEPDVVIEREYDRSTALQHAAVRTMSEWKQPPMLVRTRNLAYGLSQGSSVLDNLGRTWTITHDGGMAVRPTEIPPSNVESAGIVWLEETYGPLRILHVMEE
jgi:hypothetical protein